VTSGADDGPNSLREALESGVTKIIIKRSVSRITLTQPLIYDGIAPLKIKGSGQVIDGSELGDGEAIFQVTEGANLSISKLAFEGAGDFDITNRGGGKGIFVQVPEDREGLVSLKLTKVSVSGTGNHGVHVSDCSIGDDCGAGQGGGGDGSPASIFVRLNKVTINDAGFGKQDADGFRVDDRGEGDIIFNVTNSTFANVGGDGIELDEGDEGSVLINVRNTTFDSNGAYCSDEFVEAPISVDPSCNDDGDPDVDDAFDIDEAGPGGISGIIIKADIVDNFDEGLDFDTEGEGADNFVDLDLVNIFAAGNADEGIKVSEEGNASVVVNMRAIDVEGDVEVEEEGDGDLHVTLRGSTIGDDLKLSQEDPGVGTVKLRGTSVGDELDFENVSEI